MLLFQENKVHTTAKKLNQQCYLRVAIEDCVCWFLFSRSNESSAECIRNKLGPRTFRTITLDGEGMRVFSGGVLRDLHQPVSVSKEILAGRGFGWLEERSCVLIADLFARLYVMLQFGFAKIYSWRLMHPFLK